MSLEGASKLTKKQRKSVAFRERKKGKGKAGAFADGAADVPEVEDLDREVDDAPKDEAAVAPEPPKNAEKGKGKAKAAPLPTEDDASLDVAAAAAKGKKRKRAAAEGTGDTAVPVSDAQAASDAPKKKRKKTQAVEDGEEEQGARRMILFLGNLKYTTTREAIVSHFSACDPPPTIRLLTPKPKPGAPAAPTMKSKGCAFLEFTDRPSLQQGLRLHHSVLDGRQINVELTAGGGGKGETRLAKVQQRNKGLHEQRAKQAEQRKGTKAEASAPAEDVATLTAGKRYSATSGVEQAPTKQRTWTVGNVDDGQVHRGGVKHSKKDRKRGARVKPQASGMNAIPLG